MSHGLVPAGRALAARVRHSAVFANWEEPWVTHGPSPQADFVPVSWRAA